MASSRDSAFGLEYLDSMMIFVGQHCEVDEVFTPSQIKDWVADNLSPGATFPVEVLEKWALDNDFKKEE